MERTNSPSPKKIGEKRVKELTPNSKAPRKRYKKQDNDLADCIKKMDDVHVSPSKTDMLVSGNDQNDQAEIVSKKDEQRIHDMRDGKWCYIKDSENLSGIDIHALADDMNNLIFGTLYPKYDSLKPEETDVEVCPRNACPIRADVRTFDFKQFADFVKEKRGRKFDIIMMDPPWKFASANPTRGVCISYTCLSDQELADMPIPELQTDGFLFMWVINSKFVLALEMFAKWGYDVVDSVDWLKMTVNMRIASGHGYYLQHAFETCIIGLKGSLPPGYNECRKVPDVIYSARRGQSQKPDAIYEYCEELVKDGLFLEIFGRRNNLRNGWITIGNQI